MAFFGRRASGEYKEVLVDAEGHILTQAPIVSGVATADGAANGTTLISLLNLTVAEGLVEPDDFWNESWLAILTGDMADQRRRVTDWVLATGTLTVDPAFFNPLVSLLTVNAPLADVVIDVADASVFRAGSLLTADSPFGDLVIEVANARIFRPGNAFIWDTVTPAGEVVVITDVDETLNQLTIAAPGIVFAGGYLIANTASISMVNNALIWDDATPAGEPVTIIGIDTALNQLTLAPPGIALPAGYTVGANAAISMSRMITDGTHFRLEAVAKTEEAAWTYAHIAADAQVKATAGVLHTLTVNSCGTAGTLTLHDNPAEAGDVIAAIALPVTPVPVTLTYDLAFNNALYAGYDGTLVADITISYR